MKNFVEKIFKNKKFSIHKALNYGFKQQGKIFQLVKSIDDNFEVCVCVANDIVETKVVEKDSQEPYTLVFVEDAQGEFVGKLKEKCMKIFQDICDNCFDREVFKNKNAKLAIDYIKQKYQNSLEFLWEKFDENAVCRRKDNKKWYALFTKVSPSFFGMDGAEKFEVLILRTELDDAAKLFDKKNIFPAYHMNKRNWFSVLLDSKISPECIFDLIDKSYLKAGKKNLKQN